jgi:hypothetical protein
MGAPEVTQAYATSLLDANDLPAYQANEMVDHSYTLSEGMFKNYVSYDVSLQCCCSGNLAKPWVYLKIRSRARTANSVPLFIEGDTIAGSVVLDLRTEKKFKAITLTASFPIDHQVLFF